MSSQAEIKTKLSADGSELTRALQQGLQKGADFKTQMQGIGKSIGAAFTFAAVVQGIRTLGQEQLATIERFKGLEQEADAFTKKLENLNEKVQNAESFKAINKALLDYKQALREVGIELDALNAKEDAGGAAGILNFFGDVIESTASGNAFSADEIRLNQLEMQQERIEKARERAAKIAESRRAELRKEQRANLEEFDTARTVEQSIESGNLPAMQSFLEAAKETERQLRSAFSANPDAGLLAQIKEAVAMSDKLAQGIKSVGNQSVSTAQNLASFVSILNTNLSSVNAESTRRLISDTQDAGSELVKFLSVVKGGESEMMANAADSLRADSKSMFDFLMALGDAPGSIQEQNNRFSDLRRIGANELGRGIPASKQEDRQAQMVDLLKKLVTETGKTPEAVKSLFAALGVFI